MYASRRYVVECVRCRVHHHALPSLSSTVVKLTLQGLRFDNLDSCLAKHKKRELMTAENSKLCVSCGMNTIHCSRVYTPVSSSRSVHQDILSTTQASPVDAGCLSDAGWSDTPSGLRHRDTMKRAAPLRRVVPSHGQWSPQSVPEPFSFVGPLGVALGPINS